MANQKACWQNRRAFPFSLHAIQQTNQETEMKFALIGAAALVGIASVTPALAQAAVSYAFMIRTARGSQCKRSI